LGWIDYTPRYLFDPPFADVQTMTEF
jgi:hypothetical protein